MITPREGKYSGSSNIGKYFTTSQSPTQEDSLNYNLFVSLQSCQNLPARKQHGISDPFVKFVVGSKLVHRTKTMKGELNPMWDDIFVVVLSELTSSLEVKVYSQNLVKDDLLGLDLTFLDQNMTLENSLPLHPLPDSHLLLSLNLVCLPASDSLQPHHQPSLLLPPSPARRRKASGEANSGVLSLGLVEGRHLGDHRLGSDQEIYCKFRYFSRVRSELCTDITPLQVGPRELSE